MRNFPQDIFYDLRTIHIYRKKKLYQLNEIKNKTNNNGEMSLCDGSHDILKIKNGLQINKEEHNNNISHLNNKNSEHVQDISDMCNLENGYKEEMASTVKINLKKGNILLSFVP